MFAHKSLMASYPFSEQVGLSTLSPTPVSASVLGRPISAMSQPVTSSQHNNGGYYQNMQQNSGNGMIPGIPTPFTQTASASALPNGNPPQHHQLHQQQQHHQQEQYYWNQYQT